MKELAVLGALFIFLIVSFIFCCFIWFILDTLEINAFIKKSQTYKRYKRLGVKKIKENKDKYYWF